jgi:hypothetical protein
MERSSWPRSSRPSPRTQRGGRVAINAGDFRVAHDQEGLVGFASPALSWSFDRMENRSARFPYTVQRKDKVPFITEMTAIQKQFQDRLQSIDAEHASLVDEIENTFRQSLEDRDTRYIEARNAAIEVDVKARGLQMENPAFDSASVSESAAQVGEEATSQSIARLEQIVDVNANQLSMAGVLRDWAIQQATEERDEQIAQLLNSLNVAEAPSVPTVGAPCAACADRGDRERSNRCSARPVGITCGANGAASLARGQKFICPNCPTVGGVRPYGPCRLCPLHVSNAQV